MQFLSVASAWFAFALPAIAMMYILKKTYQDTEVASHMLWRRVLQEQEANRPWQRLRSRWLLLLQLLVALLLVLALMEPVLQRPAATTGHAVLLIDRSASMTARPSLPIERAGASGEKAVFDGAETSIDIEDKASTRLELAIAAAIRWLEEQPKGRPITIVTTGAQPEVLAARETNRDQLKAQLQTITPLYGTSDNAAALSFADSLHQEEAGGQTVLVTDGYWKDAAEANALYLQSPLNIIIVDGEQQRDNAAILYFGIKADPSGNASNVGLITVRNDSARERKITVDLYANRELAERELAAEVVVSVSPNEWQSVEVNDLPDALYYKAQLRDYADGVLTDNAAYQFPTVERARQALLVTKGNLFLEKALLLAGVKTVKISPDNAVPTGEQAKAMDWILLDGMDERLLSDPDWSELLKSKPVWMIDHPTESDASAAVPVHGRVETLEHPVTAYMTFAETHISRLARPEAAQLSWGESVLSYGGIPAIYAGIADGKPQLRYTFNLQDTDLPLRPEFPVLIVQSAQWMSGSSQLELGTAVAGQAIDLSLHSETVKAHWKIVELASAGLPAEQAQLNQVLALESIEANSYSAPTIPGLYQLIELDAANEVVGSRLLAVTADYAEFALGYGNTEKLQPKAVIGEESIDAAQPSAAPSSYESGMPSVNSSLQLWAVVLLLLFMSVEWEVYRRGHTS